ncbi:MAG: M28 family peptidase [Owenweeksia sp.]|nr:M28 family peptidase [Owenweeksia sp.]
MGSESSLYDQDVPAIHNGADDNASGVAGMLELARSIMDGEARYANTNYLFIAFSGEEMGLLGSNFFVDNMRELNLEPKMMINLDMVGRLEENSLAVNGVGTSPHWGDLIQEKGCLDLRIKTSQSGVGPSDHTSFYHAEIPVSNFFTGTHDDYHKPSDDIEKINYEGEARVLRYILGIIEQSSQIENMRFTTTTDESTKAPKFSVTLG